MTLHCTSSCGGCASWPSHLSLSRCEHPSQDRCCGPLGSWSFVLKGPAWSCCSIRYWTYQQRPIIWPGLFFWICDFQWRLPDFQGPFQFHFSPPGGFRIHWTCQPQLLWGSRAAWKHLGQRDFLLGLCKLWIIWKNKLPDLFSDTPFFHLVLVTVMEYFQWAQTGVISSDEDIWVHTANQIANTLRSHCLPVGVVLNTGQDSQSIQEALQ